ncbi:hypothetical protein [Burkholderia sp. GS2Y]|uniref:Transposase n=1 Tax=Burkholderia theae TaxID=3143496 RepID=A0ABU9WRZ7_9BURK
MNKGRGRQDLSERVSQVLCEIVIGRKPTVNALSLENGLTAVFAGRTYRSSRNTPNQSSVQTDRSEECVRANSLPDDSNDDSGVNQPEGLETWERLQYSCIERTNDRSTEISLPERSVSFSTVVRITRLVRDSTHHAR